MPPDLDRELLARRAPRPAALSRRLLDLGRQWLTTRTSRILPPDDVGDRVGLDSLISPLRVDICIRADLMRAFADGSAPKHPTPDDIARLPALSGYMAWVRHIALPLGQPQYLSDEEAIFGAFERRYQRARRLWLSVSRDGIRPDGRVRLLTGRRIRAPNGKRLGARLFAGDGCHRLACLLVLGHTHLEAGEYDVEERPLLLPHDNTARLLSTGSLSRASWLQLLARRFAPGSAPADIGSLREATMQLRPDLLAELDSVLASDLPRLPP